jgi:hypothetical protein
MLVEVVVALKVLVAQQVWVVLVVAERDQITSRQQHQGLQTQVVVVEVEEQLAQPVVQAAQAS